MQNRILLILITLAIFLAGCSSKNNFRQGEQALKNKNWDVAVSEYEKALKKDPNNPEIKMKFNMAKIFASRIHYEEAKRLMEKGKAQEAVMQLELAVQLDPENSGAAHELERLKYQIAHPQKVPLPPPTEDRPLSELPSVAHQPIFQPRSKVPIELRFKDTSLREVLLTLGKVGDVNIIFDKDFRDMPVSFDFTNTTFLQALDTVLTGTQNIFKVIGKNTILVATDNQQKRVELEETVSRTFYLSNAEVEEVARVLRNVLGIQMIATNTRLNTVTVKDRITRVIAARKIVAQMDKAKSEVVVDVEILEINRNRLQEFGLHIHSPGEDGINTRLFTKPTQLSLDPGPIVSRSNWFIANFPEVTFRLLKRDSNSRLLASLPIRTVMGETGRVRFGSQVPVPQTTFAPIATGGVNQQPITSFIYRDVGINIDITPRIHHDGEVTLEVVVESSSISGTGFANLPQFSTSRVEKTIRLKEGETNIIAGLIKDEERESMRGFPVVSDIPFIGKLFAANEKTIQETDVVLALSPHIIRDIAIAPDDEKMLYLGIDTQQGGVYRPFTPVPVPSTPTIEEPIEEPTEDEEAEADEEEQDQLQEQEQQPGVINQGDEEEEPPPDEDDE